MIVANDKGDHFRFVSVFIKKDNKTEILKKTRPVSVRFIFLGPKPVQTGLARFFPVWLGFFGLARFFSVRFGSVFPVPGLINRNRTEPVGFFKILIGLFGFFHGSVFSVIFFPVFSV
jgi:hypothetical protein